MQAIGQKALDRIHLHTSMFQTQHFYCMIIFNWKHLVLSSWQSNHLYHVHFEDKDWSASRSFSLVDALVLLFCSTAWFSEISGKSRIACPVWPSYWLGC